jgi:hypothetical protein
MRARWKMGGPEGIDNVVVLYTPLGRVRSRDLTGGRYRIRAEPEPGGRRPLATLLTRSSGWKQPGDQGQDRYSIVVRREQLSDVLGDSIGALEPGERGAEVNPSAPEWAQHLVEQARRERHI